jgi:hypothetical protein
MQIEHIESMPAFSILTNWIWDLMQIEHIESRKGRVPCRKH